MPLRAYCCEVKNTSKKVYFCILACLFIAVLLFVMPQLWPLPYSLVFFFLGMVALTVVLLLTTRFLLRRYLYRIDPTEDGGFDFVILQISGRRVLCECRVSTDSLQTLAREQPGKHSRCDYDHTVNFGIPAWILTLTDGRGSFFEVGETVTLRIMPDRNMIAMLEYALQIRK